MDGKGARSSASAGATAVTSRRFAETQKAVELKEKVPHFGSVSEADELFASVPEREPGHTALDSEDEELHPWTPSLESSTDPLP